MRRLRKKAGLTQEELAEAAGLAVRQVQRIEADGANPTLRVVADIANALNVKVKDLFLWAPTPTRRNPGRPKRRRGSQ